MDASRVSAEDGIGTTQATGRALRISRDVGVALAFVVVDGGFAWMALQEPYASRLGRVVNDDAALLPLLNRVRVWARNSRGPSDEPHPSTVVPEELEAVEAAFSVVQERVRELREKAS